MLLSAEPPLLREELADVVRLFFGLEPVVLGAPGQQPEDGRVIEFSMMEREGVWRMAARAAWPGSPPATRESIVPAAGENEIVRKRMMRRHAKLLLYRLLKEMTGQSPPWGALTGIRPVSLFRQLVREGMTRDQAMEYFSAELDVSPGKAALVAGVLDAQRGRIAWRDPQAVDVYVGIPFCRTRCLYCSFISVDLSRTDRWTGDYVGALLREIGSGAELLAGMGKKVRAAYVGGGTPTAIGRKALRDILLSLRAIIPDGCELTVEAGRPDTLDEDMLRMILGCGARRISVNPQTMNGGTLRRIGRDHTPEDVLRAMEAASRMPFDVVNMDLIMGLPGEGIPEARRTLDIVSRLPVHNLTVHTLAVKRASALRAALDRYELPDAGVVDACLELSRETAARMGMRPYYLYRQKYMSGNLENVGYALPGKECLYNIDLMEETHPVLSFGAGGISKRMDFARSLHERLANPKDVAHYIGRIEDVIRRKNEFFAAAGSGTDRGRAAQPAGEEADRSVDSPGPC